ncbi:MAG: heavy-metal-associated domain-containing protein [Lentisphaerae bacterium]|nr:heavy-metal-associated domain-containing protein [Lentisphaerota bacterium]
MKHVRLFAALLVLGLVGACRLSDMRTLVVRVPQVTNKACEDRVRQALRPLKGIEEGSLEFDYAEGTLTLRYESMILAHKNIEHAIIAVGFDANELKATDEARRALPPECRGPVAAPNAPPADGP